MDYDAHDAEPEMDDLMEWISPEVIGLLSNTCQVNTMNNNSYNLSDCIPFAIIMAIAFFFTYIDFKLFNIEFLNKHCMIVKIMCCERISVSDSFKAVLTGSK